MKEIWKVSTYNALKGPYCSGEHKDYYFEDETQANDFFEFCKDSEEVTNVYPPEKIVLSTFIEGELK